MVPQKLSGHSYTKNHEKWFYKRIDSSENIFIISTAVIYILLLRLCTRRGQPILYIFGVIGNDIIRE